MELEIDKKIREIDSVICRNIDKFDIADRGLLSANILSQLRNFVEHIALKVFANGKDIDDNFHTNIKPAVEYIKSQGALKFLSRFHNFLQITVSHYTPDEESSERLMLKYYEYLIRTKKFLKEKYGLEVLANLEKFPISGDKNLQEYYEKIAGKILAHKAFKWSEEVNERCYIHKIKPFFVNGEIFYEVTFTEATGRVSKFDRIIAFTKIDISKNYAVKLSIVHSSIAILGRTMPVLIIDGWEVSIRPCEIEHFSAIFGNKLKTRGDLAEYKELMNFLTQTGFSLTEFVSFDDSAYNGYKAQILVRAKTHSIFNILDLCRTMIKDKMAGNNIVRYLLYRMNNRVIKAQKNNEKCDLLSGLELKYGCIPFEQMPYNSSLVGHNPKLMDLFECINPKEREHELLARFVKNNTEIHGHLYTPVDEIERFSDIEELRNQYNNALYYKHQSRKLEVYKKHIYIKDYEDDTRYIIERLKELALSGIDNYANSVISWLNSVHYSIDSEEKKAALMQMFEHSKVALIYGSAGTGKSTLINHISNFFADKKKLYLANTHPAVENLRRKVNAAKPDCSMTIAKFLSGAVATDFDVLFIDECSTVSNKDMRGILEKATFKLLVLVGDIYQIESIIFGNWFSLSKECIADSSITELKHPYRTNNKKLLDLWDKVRNYDDAISEHLVKNKYSISIDQSIFERGESDEIILCLNYDGLYGINNLNKFLQESNPNTTVKWGVKTYKVNDPILFNESNRFAPLIYNNLKGRIANIKLLAGSIQFDVEIDKAINELDAAGYNFSLLPSAPNGNSIIRFAVTQMRSTDEDDDERGNDIVPFQVAYAVSIHKAQGLEFNSVKVVITDEIDEMITHNIFYTAITRAKERLKIYWSPETEKKVLESFVAKDDNKDYFLLSGRYKINK